MDRLTLLKEWSIPATLLVSVFALRLTVLDKYPTPPSEDLGGHLVALNAYLGRDVVRPDYRFHHPPLYYFLVLWPLTVALPVFAALKVAEALVSTIVAVPFLLLSRRLGADYLSSLVATTLFVFSEYLSETIGWGGMPSVFGVFFMLFSAYYLVKALHAASWKDCSIAGIFASLTVGTHPFTAFYYSVTASILALVHILLRRRRWLLKLLAVFMLTSILLSLPYAGVYLYLATHSPSSLWRGLYSNPWSDLSLHLALASDAVARSPASLIVFLAIGLASFIKLWVIDPATGRGSRHAQAVIIMTSFGAAVPILSSTLNAYAAIRAFYMTPIFVFLAFSIFLSDVVRSARSRTFLMKVGLSALIAIVASVLVQGSYARLVGAVEYYHILSDEAVEALDWLRNNTGKNATVITNYNALGGWIQGYALRKALSVRAYQDLSFFATSPDYQETFDAIRIISGNQIVENGYFLVHDAFPAIHSNPAIVSAVGSGFAELAYLDDQSQFLQISPSHQHPDVSGPRPLAEGVKTLRNVSAERDRVAITYDYTWPFGTVTRVVEVSRAPHLDITYAASLGNQPIKEFKVTVNLFHSTRVRGYIVRNRAVTLDLATPTGDIESLTVEAVEALGELSATFVPREPRWQGPAVVFVISGADQRLQVKLRISLTTKLDIATPVRYANAYDLLKAYDITYLVLDKRRQDSLTRFSYESRYKPAYENERILILKVQDS